MESELKPTGVAARAFTHWSILLLPIPIFLKETQVIPVSHSILWHPLKLACIHVLLSLAFLDLVAYFK